MLRAAVLVLTVCATSVDAQMLRGVVVHPDSTSPAQGVLVEVRGDVSGSFRTLTDPRGNFSVRLPRPDSVRVRVLRLGFRPTEVATVFVAEPSPLMRIVLDASPYNLSVVRVAAASRCGKRADNEGFLRWEQALTVLRTVDFTRQDRDLRIRTVEYEGPTSIGGVTRIPSDSALRLVDAIAPPPAVHYDSLFERGYVRRNREDTLMTYYAPDARVLTDDRFTAGYCFRSIATSDSVPGLTGVSFTPVGRRGVADIEGTVWLDRATLELQRIEFAFVQLPAGHNIAGPGGYVEFRKLPTGHWIINEWMLRMAQHLVRLDRCNVNVQGVMTPPPRDRGGCAYIVRSSNGLWGRSQVVASVVHSNVRLYYDEFAESLARRAEQVVRDRR